MVDKKEYIIGTSRFVSIHPTEIPNNLKRKKFYYNSSSKSKYKDSLNCKLNKLTESYGIILALKLLDDDLIEGDFIIEILNNIYMIIHYDGSMYDDDTIMKLFSKILFPRRIYKI